MAEGENAGSPNIKSRFRSTMKLSNSKEEKKRTYNKVIKWTPADQEVLIEASILIRSTFSRTSKSVRVWKMTTIYPMIQS